MVLSSLGAYWGQPAPWGLSQWGAHTVHTSLQFCPPKNFITVHTGDFQPLGVRGKRRQPPVRECFLCGRLWSTSIRDPGQTVLG